MNQPDIGVEANDGPPDSPPALDSGEAGQLDIDPQGEDDEFFYGFEPVPVGEPGALV